jgi:hypothetical protein
VRSPEEIVTHLIEDSYRRAYLKGKKSLKWMVGIIRSSSLRGSEVLAVLDRIDKHMPLDEPAKTRVDELRKELKRLGFT